MGRLTTHVLDTAQGRPAAGLRIELYIAGGGRIAEAVTNADGRLDRPILEGAAFRPGRYRLLFHVGAYFATSALPVATVPFLEQVPVEFGIADGDAHYHVPLLVSPYGYSTYRGS